MSSTPEPTWITRDPVTSPESEEVPEASVDEAGLENGWLWSPAESFTGELVPLGVGLTCKSGVVC